MSEARHISVPMTVRLEATGGRASASDIARFIFFNRTATKFRVKDTNVVVLGWHRSTRIPPGDEQPGDAAA